MTLTKDRFAVYTAILKEELVPAMGCTEPIAIAYAAAKAQSLLGEAATEATVEVSGNILKNVKSVIVPHTGGLRGIEAACLAGISVGNADAELEVLSSVTDEDLPKIAEARKRCRVKVKQAVSPCVFVISVTLSGNCHTVSIRIEETHTNLVLVTKDGETLFEKRTLAAVEEEKKHALSVEDILDYAENIPLDEVKPILDRQIAYNMAIAKEGLAASYGANIGKVLLSAYPNDVRVRAKAYAAAGSDARMNGCEMPVIINSGSGNQGITASVPVIVYARETGASEERLYRALLVSNLVTLHLKSGVGTLSAYCGVVSAGAGAGAGIAYLLGGGYKEIAHTVVNALAIDSGVICDGAKGSCAAKIAIAVESGILGYEMYRLGNQFYSGDGIVKKGVENTIKSVSSLAREGMKETDKEILKLMTEDM